MRIDEKDCLSISTEWSQSEIQGMLMIIEETLQNHSPNIIVVAYGKHTLYKLAL